MTGDRLARLEAALTVAVSLLTLARAAVADVVMDTDADTAVQRRVVATLDEGAECIGAILADRPGSAVAS